MKANFIVETAPHGFYKNDCIAVFNYPFLNEVINRPTVYDFLTEFSKSRLLGAWKIKRLKK